MHFCLKWADNKIAKIVLPLKCPSIWRHHLHHLERTAWSEQSVSNKGDIQNVPFENPRSSVTDRDVIMTTNSLSALSDVLLRFCRDGEITRDELSRGQKHTDTRRRTFVVIYMIKYHSVVSGAKAFCSVTHSDFSLYSSELTKRVSLPLLFLH